MSLSRSQRRYLKGLAHHIKPVVMVADRGLSENVVNEIRQQLDHHELIKIRVRAERDTRDAIMGDISRITGAESIQQIGQIGVFYRRNPDNPRLALPAGDQQEG